DDHRERRLAEPWWAGEQDVVGRATLHRGRVEQQLQLPAHLRLPDELGERARAKRALERELGLGLGGGLGLDRLDHRSALLVAHGRTCWGPRRASASRRIAGTDIPSFSSIASTTSSTACAATRSFQPSPTSADTTFVAIEPLPLA